MANWRLIPLMTASGATQMAIDEWLLEQHRLGNIPSTLRFYTWTPPALSLGYHQRHWPHHWNDLMWEGQRIDLVRRPSGGRAVLHWGDLTYAVITSDLPGRRMEVYQTICQFLIDGWRSLGIPLQYGTAGRGYIHNPNCFGTATGADLITTTGAKVIGSAQLRRGNAILQHGSMQLHPNRAVFEYVFGVSMAEISVSPQVEHPVTFITRALTEAARHCFSAEFSIHPLTPDEWQGIIDS